MKKIAIACMLGLLCLAGCNKNDTHTSSSSRISSVTLHTSPSSQHYLVNQNLNLTGASLKVVYANQETEIVPIRHEMVTNVHMETVGVQSPTVTFFHHQITFPIYIYPYISVSTEDELLEKMESCPLDTAIYLNQSHFSFASFHIQRGIKLFGNGKTIIESQNTIQITASDVLLSQIKFSSNSSSYCLSIQGDNVQLDNLEIYGGKGTKVYLSNINCNRCRFFIQPLIKSVAISIISSDVKFKNCYIQNGTWGSIGLLHPLPIQNETYPGNKTVDFLESNIITNHIYIEYNQESNNKITNLNWNAYPQGSTLFYWNPRIKRESFYSFYFAKIKKI